MDNKQKQDRYSSTKAIAIALVGSFFSCTKDTIPHPRPMFIDWGVASLAEYPIGSIGMLLLSVTLWELTTPGRAKK